MSIKERIGQIWTAAVAYVALGIGAGLSITFNVVDVMSTRGSDVDEWDIVTAVAFPAIVVLMVELFVSRLWIGQSWPMQVIRWTGTAAIGGIAMRVSWTHGHDFFLSRGQTSDVATFGPLAIDLLAIMATALILSGRGHGHVPVDTTPEPAPLSVSKALDIKMRERDMAIVDKWNDRHMSDDELDAILGRWVPTDIATAELDVVAEAESILKDDPAPVSAPPAIGRAKVPPAIVAEHIREARSQGIAGARLSALVAGQLGISAKTVTRNPAWREAS